MVLRQFIGDYELENKNKSGVYRIYHLNKPDKCYVGSARYTTNRRGFEYRWRDHISFLKRGKHDNPELQNVVNKYSINGIKIEILEICDNEFCISFERWWNYWLSNTYNVNSIQESARTGVKHLNATKLKISRANKGKVVETILVPISKYDLEGNYICTYSSISSAARDVNGNPSHIRASAIGKLRKSANFQWRLNKIENGIDSIRKRLPTCIPLKVVGIKENSILYFDSVSLAAESLNINKSSIQNCLSLNQLTKTAGGYRWIYLKDWENEEKYLKPGTQSITGIVVDNIKKLINGHNIM